MIIHRIKIRITYHDMPEEIEYLEDTYGSYAEAMDAVDKTMDDIIKNNPGGEVVSRGHTNAGYWLDASFYGSYINHIWVESEEKIIDRWEK